MSLQIELEPHIEAVDARQWDALCGDDDPFIEHGFLLSLERSGSVGGRSGWTPLHLLLRRQGRLVGALPLYAKQHSYGEYIFDWSWAGAAERAGIEYYPKLVSMVPFTPATGKRLLIAADEDSGLIARAMISGVEAAREQLDASSIHFLFLAEEEQKLLTSEGHLLPRLTSQFHFHNRGYGSFDELLQDFRSALRKQVRRERRQAAESGLELRILEGPELGDREWNALREFYMDTCFRRGSGPYLTRSFFDELRAIHAHRVVAALAFRGRTPVAGTLNFQKGKNLYGRYWGCTEERPGVHFELCYYALIERVIEQGLSRFEAGAQGSHKLRRGLMPAAVHSAHHLAHGGLRAAVADYLRREADGMRMEMAELSMHGPFKRA
ncbi:MAG: GNAT family N-acetyltransferase [Myxococcales bacterium]|nr:GNAT family N-acetyltransferase [Myxococcales bacterium]